LQKFIAEEMVAQNGTHRYFIFAPALKSFFCLSAGGNAIFGERTSTTVLIFHHPSPGLVGFKRVILSYHRDSFGRLNVILCRAKTAPGII